MNENQNAIHTPADRQDIEDDLAGDRYDDMCNLATELTGHIRDYSVDAMIDNAHDKAVRDLLVKAGVCSYADFDNAMADNIEEELRELAESGAVDAAYLESATRGE